MIHWSLVLTGNQIAILKALKGREFGKAWDSPHITHWIGGVRTLIREGLIEQRETKLPNGYNDMTRTGQFLTARGLFLLDLIEQDIAKFLSPEAVAKLPKRKLRKVS